MMKQILRYSMTVLLLILLCACGQHEHRYGEWEETLAPSCVATGEEARFCSDCGNCETRALAATERHAYEKIADREATESEDGYVTYTCTSCGHTYTTTVYAYGSPSLDYTETDGGYLVTKGTDSERTVVIPSYYRGKPVIGIADGAFLGNETILYVRILEGVTRIGEQAFRECLSLRSVSLPESMTEIGKGAFRDCQNLASIEIPSGVAEIEEETFYGCASLIRVELAEGVTHIGAHAFSYCNELGQVVIPKTIKGIGDAAFLPAKDQLCLYYAGTEEDFYRIALGEGILHSHMSVSFCSDGE